MKYTTGNPAHYDKGLTVPYISYSYEYDRAGNIKKVTDKDGTTVRYFYDERNQLVLEMNGYSNETYYYTYDTYGNIRSKNTDSIDEFEDYADFLSMRGMFKGVYVDCHKHDPCCHTSCIDRRIM